MENTQKAVGKGKAPSLGTIGKSTSADGKFSRASLTRGGSQEDPVQLLRDLQDSMERETDIREQLKFAEEEVTSLKIIDINSVFKGMLRNEDRFNKNLSNRLN